jgi:hypothetical protein
MVSLLPTGRQVVRPAEAPVESLAQRSEVPARAGRWSAVGTLAAAAALLLVAGAAVAACYRPLWNDELFTLTLATLPTWGDTLAALRTGGEQLPLPYYGLMRGVAAVLGTGALALRLPALLGFLGGCAAIFLFLHRRIARTEALIAALLPSLGPFHFYAFEARPYGLVLGLSGAALCCWQRVAEPARRRRALAGLFLSLALAVACHYYAALVVVPLAAGELVRTHQRRRIDGAAWAVLVGAPVPALLGSLPLLAHVGDLAATFWARPSLLRLAHAYAWALVPVGVLGLAVLLTALARACLRPAAPRALARPTWRGLARTLPADEWAAVLGLAALPLLAWGLAHVTGAFTDRYAIGAVLGVSILAVLPLSALLRSDPAQRVALALVVVGAVAVKQLLNVQAARRGEASLRASIALLEGAGGGQLPIVAATTLELLPLAHYAPPALASRLLYLTDEAAAQRILGHSSVERSMRTLVGPWFGLHIRDYAAFMRAGGDFLLFGQVDGEHSWVLARLREEGRSPELQQQLRWGKRPVYLYRVRRGAAGGR